MVPTPAGSWPAHRTMRQEDEAREGWRGQAALHPQTPRHEEPSPTPPPQLSTLWPSSPSSWQGPCPASGLNASPAPTPLDTAQACGSGPW